MNNIFLYLLKSAISLGILYLFYLAVLRQITWFRINRIYLIASILFSLAIPLITIPVRGDTSLSIQVITLDEIRVSVGISDGTVSSFGFWKAILYLYLSGTILFFIRFIMNLIRIHIIWKSGGLIRQNGIRIVLTDKNFSTFSFLNSIFMTQQSFDNPDFQSVLIHERTHIRQLHTLDVLLTEILVIIHWFNPAAWAIKRAVNENHEFIADQEVLGNGFNLRTYRIRIIEELFGARFIPVTHSFNRSITNKRLGMMEKARSTKLAKYKIMLVLPVAGILFFIFTCTQKESDKIGENPMEEIIPAESLVYLEPETMAEFPGGIDALRKFIIENLKYPEEAAKNKVQGKIYLQFVVDETGKVEQFVNKSGVPPPPPPKQVEELKVESTAGDVLPPTSSSVTINAGGITVVKFIKGDESANYSAEHIKLLEDEAIRVIKMLPDFKPAIQDGKPVKVMFTFPINFVLE
ncbi:MAG: hypothetical protein AMS27_05710 [Bacteroides sp. SM23_62_1]|nr:MAG: hypothetical protein AMS27_05710 [Bacteroides sp. SM23_62_1]